MKKIEKKLPFKKETVRTLTDSQVQQAAGGVVTTALTCTNSVVICHHTQRCSHHCTTAINCSNHCR